MNIKEIANDNKDEFFVNRGTVEAVDIVVNIFKYSRKIVRIYSRNWSTVINTCDLYHGSMVDFLNRGGELKIILEETVDVDNKVYAYLKYSIFMGQQYNDKISIVSNIGKCLLINNESTEIHIGDYRRYCYIDNIHGSYITSGNFNDNNTTVDLINKFEMVYDPIKRLNMKRYNKLNRIIPKI